MEREHILTFFFFRSSSISSSSSQHCPSSHSTISEYSANLADSSLISNSSLDDSSPMDDTPLDFSLKKRSSPSPPPPYRYSNPLRQHSPPAARTPAVSPPRLHQSTAPPYVFPVFNPPPYPRSPSPPSPAARPPPPSYEAAMAAKPKSPTICRQIPTTNPTFLTLSSRPIPSAFPLSPPLQIKQEGGLRPLVQPVPLVPSYLHEDLGSENKENKEKELRKITIVEGLIFK